jgi:hypothetical protein
MPEIEIDDSLAVPSTSSALAELRARPMHAERAKHFEVHSFEVVDDQAGSLRFGNVEHQRVAAAIGLRRLGVISDSTNGMTINKEMWVTQNGVATVSLTDPDRYFIGTYFDDGSAQLTWKHAEPRTKSQPGTLVSSGGTGDLSADVAAHMTRVKAELSRGRRFFKVDDVETANELGRHYYRHVVPLDLIVANEQVRRANARAPFVLVGIGIAIVVGIIAILTR